MKSLENLYTLFQQSMLSQQPLIESQLKTPPKGSLRDRIAIYADGYYGRLQETLASDYEILAFLLGDKAFSHLCKIYVTAYPSTSYSLNFLGQHLSRFLSEKSPFKKSPWLAEIAACEWAEAEAFSAVNARLLTIAELQSQPAEKWPELQFYLHPSCHLLQLQWNSFAMMQTFKTKKRHLKPAKMKNPKALLIWRCQLQIRQCFLDNLELNILEAIQKNCSFMAICELLSQEMQDDEAAKYLVSKLYSWLQDKIFVHKD